MKTILSAILLIGLAFSALADGLQQSTLNGGTNNVGGTTTNTQYAGSVANVFKTTESGNVPGSGYITLSTSYALKYGAAAVNSNVVFGCDFSVNAARWQTNAFVWTTTSTGTNQVTWTTNLFVGATPFIRLNFVGSPDLVTTNAVTNLYFQAFTKTGI